MKHLPAHIAWPLAIVVLLLSNVGVAVGTLIIANSKGGVQIVPDYYTQAVSWDSLAALQNDAQALGWKTAVAASLESDSIVVRISDRNGTPVRDLNAVVSVYRPSSSSPVGTFSLTRSPTPGQYAAEIALTDRGLYDFSVAASRGATRYVHAVRLDIK